MDYLQRSPALSEVSEDRERSASLLPSTNPTLPLEKSGEASAEVHVKHPAGSGQDGDPGMSLR